MAVDVILLPNNESLEISDSNNLGQFYTSKYWPLTPSDFEKMRKYVLNWSESEPIFGEKENWFLLLPFQGCFSEMKTFVQKCLKDANIIPPKPLDKNIEAFYTILPFALIGGALLAIGIIIYKKVK